MSEFVHNSSMFFSLENFAHPFSLLLEKFKCLPLSIFILNKLTHFTQHRNNPYMHATTSHKMTPKKPYEHLKAKIAPSSYKQNYTRNQPMSWQC